MPPLQMHQSARLAVAIVSSGFFAIAAVCLGAGQDDRQIAFAKSQALDEPLQPKRKETTSVWAHGTVRDEKGQPVADAVVYAVTVLQGIRLYQTILGTRSDAQGHWRIEASSMSSFGGDVIVVKRGHPPTSLPLPPQSFTDKEPDAQEIILPAHGGKLEVQVLQDGKPLAKAGVQLLGGLRLPGVHPFGINYKEAQAEVEGIISPVRTTNAEGVANFDNLRPGLYKVRAAASGIEALKFAHKDNYGNGDGVAVVAGETGKFSLNVYRPLHNVAFEVRHTDGKPPSHQDVRIATKGENGRSGWGGGPFGEGSKATAWVNGPGLWGIEVRYGASAPQAPFYEAVGSLALSPLLAKSPPPVLTARLRRPGSVVVHLRDVHGKPVRGGVCANRVPEGFGFIETNAQGERRVEGLQAEGQLEVEATLPGDSLPNLFGDEERFPADKSLVGRVAFPMQVIEPVLDKEIHITLQARPIGYVRGVLRPPKGRKLEDYSVIGQSTGVIFDTWLPRCRYNNKTGEFIAGPSPVGKATLNVQHILGVNSSSFWKSEPFEIRQDRVAQIELHPPAEPTDWPSVEGDWIASPIRGMRVRVFLPDGKTPAHPADLALFVPNAYWQMGSGQTDGLGRVYLQSARGLWWSSAPRDPFAKVLPGTPTKPTLVALLPGSHGAAIVAVPALDVARKELKIVLPPAMSCRGKLTVGGKDIRSRNQQFRVRAGYVGKGDLDALLSVTVTPQADGRFELAGLTPGKYRVQAAMDGIWLSASKQLIVGPDAAQPVQLDLNIDEPGPCSLIEVVEAKGKPLAGVELTLQRPAGPLADALWPAQLFSDGAGIIHIPPLEAGEHQMHVAGEDCKLVVAPLAAKRAETKTLRIVVD